VIFRVRKGWRCVLVSVAALGGLASGVTAPRATADPPPPTAVAPPRPDRAVRLTVEVAWSSPPGPGGATVEGPVEVEVAEGRVLEAVAWPGGPGGEPDPATPEGGAWRLGPASRPGRVRARVEADLAGSLLLRAGGQALRFPLASILEGPQRTPPQSPVGLSVERVAWDAIAVDFGPAEPPGSGADGVAAPGAMVPATVSFPVIAPEAGEVALRCAAELRPVRGGEPVWRHELRETVPTNAASPPAFVLPVQAPSAEGAYVLELRATWEPAPGHDGGKLLNRLIRRGRRGHFGPSWATRRVTLAVLAPAEAPPPPARDQEVDSVDLARPRGNRPSASGRSPSAGEGRSAWGVPDAALAEASRRDRLRGWITGTRSGLAALAPADPSGLAWSAIGLKVAHPGRPHRLALTVAGGHPADLGVAVVGAGAKPRLLLDACASGPPVLPGGPAAAFSWLVWPDAADPVLVVVNRSGGAAVQVGSVTLTELGELPAGPAVEPPAGAPTRGLGLVPAGPDPLERFGAYVEPGLADLPSAARELVRYASYCGATTVVLPESLADRPRRRALEGFAAEDAAGPDRLGLALRVLARRDLAAWVELSFAGPNPLPGLPDPGSPAALAGGLARLDRRGEPDGAAYHLLSPAVRDGVRRRVAGAAERSAAGHPNFAGLVVRLGPGPTLLGGPDTGFDDATFARFVGETFDPATARGVPGQGGDGGRFAARSAFLAGPGRMPWLTWRSKRVAALYGELAEAARRAAPGAGLAVVTPGSGGGAAGAEARRADLAGLAPSLAWRAVGLDLDAWPAGDAGPLVLRGAGPGADDLAHDLATNPELDAKVAARPVRGLLFDAGEPGPGDAAEPGLALTAPAVDGGPTGDEPLGHALAALDARDVWLAGPAVAGHEERVRRFARAFRALPAAPPAERRPSAFGVAVRAYRAGGRTYLGLANDTPYPVRLDAALAGGAAAASAPVYDFGRGTPLRAGSDASGRHLVLDLLPFGVAALRVDAPGVGVASVTPYPSETVLTSMRARFEGLTDQLSRLGHGGETPRPGPPNPGFEVAAAAPLPAPAPADAGAPADGPGFAAAGPPADGRVAPAGWQAVGGSGGGLALDPAGPHAGRGALRLDAPALPASAVCDEFAPNAQAAMLVRAWLRADRDDARVRLWVEGQAAGRPFRQSTDLAVGAAWAEHAARAGAIPAGGLDAARVRFEMLTPGRLWVDDLAVSGEALSEPERRNARNALLAALQAYREKRYADFARLAGSHWARLPAAGDTGAAGPADGAGLSRADDATGLPQGRLRR